MGLKYKVWIYKVKELRYLKFRMGGWKWVCLKLFV